MTKTMQFCPLYLISLPPQEFSWIARLHQRISQWQPGRWQHTDMHMLPQPALKEQVGQEAALSELVKVPDLERWGTGRSRHHD